MRVKTLALAALLSALALPAFADEAALLDLARTSLAAIATDPALIKAVKDQNAMSAAYEQATIDAFDGFWKSETGKDAHPYIDAVLNNTASKRLAAAIGEDPRLTLLLVLDAKGLNAGATGMVDDYWQGDEDIWLKSGGAGPDAVYAGPVAENAETKAMEAEIAIPVLENGTVIGALVARVDTGKL